MELDEYKNTIAKRHGDLSEEEKETVRRMIGTPVGNVLTKLVGPELGKAITVGQPTTTSPKRSGLGSR
jgi:hypothetical protein